MIIISYSQKYQLRASTSTILLPKVAKVLVENFSVAGISNVEDYMKVSFNKK